MSFFKFRKKQRPEKGVIDYGAEWDNYAKNWKADGSDVNYIGDEWTGEGAGAAKTRQEYDALIISELVKPYIESTDHVMEIGVGGGKTSAMLLDHCASLLCTDVSQNMLDATRNRLGSDSRIAFKKLNGIDFDGIEPGSLDVCFSFDSMVHMEPRDIYNYVTRIPALLRGKRTCIFHHGNMTSELGWQQFLKQYEKNIAGKRTRWVFSVMTDQIMEKFLISNGYKILKKNTAMIPRDCVWVCQAPEVG